ncbi:MAG: TIGR01777 family oxidoreductase [Flavisolibacter sp.]
MATILITGGTGLIGRTITRALIARGDEVIILTRSKRKSDTKNLSYASWNPSEGTIDETAIGKADAIIHLAGANVAEKRWTRKRKLEIRESRVASGNLLARSLQSVPNKVKCLVSASATGYYGPDPMVPNPRPFVESDPPGEDFLGSVAQEWEAAVAPVGLMNKKLAILRTGIVLSREGGAYPEFKKPLRYFISSILGNGKQVVSWIHIDDLVRLYVHVIDKGLEGVYNAVAPNPVSNKELVEKLAKISNRVSIPLHVPSFVLKAVLGEMSIEVLKSTTVSSAKLQSQGFQFLYPTIKEALKELNAHSNSRSL